MSENINGSVKLGAVRIEKEVTNGKLVFTFNSVTKGADGKVEKKVELARWSGIAIEDVPTTVRAKAEEHGFLQKYGDALAGKKEYTIDEATQILDDMAAGHMAGDWNKQGRTKKEQVKAVGTDEIDAILASNPAFASMNREMAIALVTSLGLMKK